MAILSNILSGIVSAVGGAMKGAAAAASSSARSAGGVNSTITMPTVKTPKQTARQRMLAQEEDEEERRWYKGNEPTSSEIVARIYSIGKDDSAKGEQLWNAFSQLSADPSSPVYNPYTRATNNAVEEMGKLGFDVSGGITEDWLAKHSGLMNSYRKGASGTPLSPSSKSTPENDAAYWYYQILGDEERTQKAENEWAALQEEITYWTKRKDRNYSDQEILDRIDWSNYSTLTSMDEAKGKGVPLSLNRAVGYSQDALAGVIWAARNNGGTGNAMIDSVKAALGEGNAWQQDEEIAARLDPMSDRYNPYAVGATIDEEALYFDVDGFDSKWLEENRGYLASRDKTAKKLYGKVYDAEQNTAKAEQELEELWRRVEDDLKYTSDPEYILKDLLDSRGEGSPALSTLKKMDESLKSGDIMATTRAVDYRWQDVEAEVRRRCKEKETAQKGDAYVQGVAGTLGATVPSVSSNDAINANKDSAVSAAGGSIAKDGTDEEKIVWKNAYSSNYETYVGQMHDSIVNGTANAQGGTDYALSRANDYAAKNYMEALETVQPYDEAQKNLKDVEEVRAAVEADTSMSEDEKAAALSEINAYATQQQMIVEDLEAKQAKARRVMDFVTQGYSISMRLAELTGSDMREPEGVINALNYAYQFATEYTPNWHAYNLYDAAIAEGNSYETVAKAAQEGKAQTEAKIAEIESVLKTISDQNMVLDRKYITNMEREIARLQGEVKEADYFLMREQEDFDQVVSEGRKKVAEAWGLSEDGSVSSFLDPFKMAWAGISGHGGYSDIAAAMVQGKNAYYEDEREFAQHMTQEEIDTYFYILEKQGNEAADEYFESMTNENNGIVHMRKTQNTLQSWKDFSKEHEIAGSALSVVMSPMQLSGTFYGIKQSAKELLGLPDNVNNPNSAAYLPSRMINTARETVKGEITSALGENTFASTLANIGYDALMSTGDNAMTALTLGPILGKASMGATFASQSMLSSAEKGATATQTLLSAGIGAAIESVTESNQFEAFSGKFMGSITRKNAAPLIKHMIESVGIEFVGEGTSEVLGQITDKMIMGELSDFDAMVDAYRLEGMSKEDAQMAALKDCGKNVLYAAVVGGVSGGMSGAFTYNGQNAPQTEQNETTEGTDTQTEEAPVEAQEAADEDEQFPIQAPEQQPTDGPQPLTQEEMEAAEEQDAQAKTARTVAALTQALTTEDVASRTATIAAVMSTGEGDPNKQAAINAAAQHLADKYGSEDAVNGMRSIVMTTAEKGIREDKVNEAIAIASLSEGEASQALEVVMSDPSEENLVNLVEAAERDMTKPEVAAAIQKTVAENKIAAREKQLIADGARSGIKSYESGVAQARSNVQDAQQNLEKAQREQAVAGQNLQTVNAEFVANPTNEMLRGAAQQAIKDAEGKAYMTAQAERGLQNAQDQLTEAEKTLETMSASTMKQIREQAQQDVLAEAQAQEQAEAQAIEDARVQAYNDAVGMYKPVAPSGKMVKATVTGGAEINLIGVHSVENTPDGYLMFMDDEGNVHSEETLNIDDSEYVKQLMMDDSISENAKKTPMPDVNFKHGVAVQNNATGEVSYVVGLVADATETAKYMLTNGSVVSMNDYTALNEDGMELLVDNTISTHPDVFSQASTPAQSSEETKPKKAAKPQPELQLESWQDPQYHGKVKKPRKLNTKTKNFKSWFNDPTPGKLLSNPDGSPKVIYRGTTSQMRMEHKAGAQNGPDKINNFYSPDVPIAASYAGKSKHIFKLYDIVNWETAAAAMADEGFELKKVQKDGVWGYRPVGNTPETSYSQGDFYREDELERFNKEYGQIRRNGLYAGYISVKNPLVIDGNNKVYTQTHATVLDKNGQPFTATMKNRLWGDWARANGYDACIVLNTYDYIGGKEGTKPPGTVIMTFGSEKFKSIYNTGKLGKKEADIRYSKKTPKGTFKLTGEPVSKQMTDVLDKLAAGQKVTEEELWNLPEVKWAESQQPRDENGDKLESIKDYEGDEERAEARKEIQKDLMELGSAVIDSEGKAKYTGPVRQGKRLDIVMGTPASGKSSALANYVSRMFGSRILDSDMAKEPLEGYNDGLTSGYVHEESRLIWKGAIAEAIANGDNTLLPVVGHSYKSVRKNIDQFKSAGYEVHVHYVQLDDAKTIGRAMNRMLEDGRYISPDYLILANGEKISGVYEQLKEEGVINGYSKWDNDVKRGDHPILLESENEGFEEEGRLVLFGGRGDRGGLGRSGQPVPSESEQPGEPSGTSTGSGVDYSLSAPTGASFIGADGKKVGKIKSGYQILKDLSEALNMPADPRIKKFLRTARKKASGYRMRGRNIVHIQDASDIETAAHEFGHIFDEALGLRSAAPTRQMISFLQNHPNPNVRAWIDSYEANLQPGEVVAEFAKYWIKDRNQAIAFAGKDFVEHWEKALDSKGWLKPMQQAAQELRLNYAASERERIKVSIDLEDKRNEEKGSWFNRLRRGLADYTLPFDEITRAMRKHLGDRYDASKDVRVLKLAQPSIVDNLINSCLHTTMVDPQGNVVLDRDGNELGSFEDIISEVSIDDEKDFNAFMVALHSLDRAKAKKLLIDKNIDADAAIRDILSEHPEWMDIAVKLENWYEAFMQTWLVDTGLLEQSAFKHMRDMYPFYVPGFRTGIGRGNGATGPGNTMGNAVGRATGGTQNIYNPIMGFVEYMQKYVTNYKTIEAMRAFYDSVLTTPGLEAIAEPMQADIEHVNRQPANEAAMEAVREAIRNVQRNNSGTIDAAAETAILDAIEGLSPDGWIYKDTASGNDVLNIPLANGKMGRLTVYNKEMLGALLRQTTVKRNAIMRAIGTVTRFLSANATGRNPMFAIQNFAGDSQTTMNTGGAKYQGPGKNAVTDFLSGTWLGFIPMQIAGTADYLNNVIRDAAGLKTSEAYRQFQIFGKLGYSHSSRSGKTQQEMRRSIYGKGKQLNAANVKYKMGKIAYAPIAAVEEFAGFFEDASRYVQYKGSGTGETYGERLEQGKVAREASVDFSKQGEWGEDIGFVKTIIPFFGATVQGIDKTLAMFTKENEGKRAQIATRLVVNGIMTQLVISALRNATWDEEEKEAYDRMSVYEKNKYHHIKLPSGKFIRIKRSQDAIIQYADAIGDVLGSVVSGNEGDAWGDLVAFSKEIASNLALSFDTVFDPFIDARNNTTYYGGIIDDYNMEKLSSTERYNSETPALYRALSALSTMGGMELSPQQVEYVIGQFTGSYGAIGSGILQLGAENNLTAQTMADMIVDYIAGKFSVDPVFSNDISTTFYDGKEKLETMLNEVGEGHSPAYLSGNLTDEEANRAIADGKALLKGDVEAAYKTAKELWGEYDAILENELMTPSEQESAAREIREQINQVMLSANVKISDYWNKYGVVSTGQAAAQNFLELFGKDISVPTMPTAYDELPQTFLDDEDQPYMQKAKTVFDATGKASALPHPNTEFELGGTEYEIGDEDWDGWTAAYKAGYTRYLESDRGARGFENMTSEEQLAVLKKAHTAGHEASKKWYLKKHEIQR